MAHTVGCTSGWVLSQILFEATAIPLHDSLKAEGCGATFKLPNDTLVRIVCLLIVDDVVLPNDTPELTRKALKVACEWARSCRLRWNVGAEKNTIIFWDKGHTNVADSRRFFTIAGRRVPRVVLYRYGGIIFQSDGGWCEHLTFLLSKVVAKTRHTRNCA